MRIGYRPRWWRDPLKRSTVIEFVVVVLALLLLLGHEWRATDPQLELESQEATP